MDPIPANGTITEPGEYSSRGFLPGSSVHAEFEIGSGSPTVSLGYKTPSGNFRPALLLDGSEPDFGGENGGSAVLVVGITGQLAVKVEGAGEVTVGFNEAKQTRAFF